MSSVTQGFFFLGAILVHLPLSLTGLFTGNLATVCTLKSPVTHQHFSLRSETLLRLKEVLTEVTDKCNHGGSLIRRVIKF